MTGEGLVLGTFSADAQTLPIGSAIQHNHPFGRVVPGSQSVTTSRSCLTACSQQGPHANSSAQDKGYILCPAQDVAHTRSCAGYVAQD